MVLLLLPIAGGARMPAPAAPEAPAPAAASSAPGVPAPASPAAAASTVTAPAPANDALALHVLQRLGYGPRPGDVARVLEAGVDRYIDDQLHPERLFEPGALGDALSALASWPMGWAERFQKVGPPALDAAVDHPDDVAALRAQADGLLRDDQAARVLMALESPRQLQEVLVEFWFDHFNIDTRGSPGHFWAGCYEREAIRPHVLGHFRELLEATARSPAMLAYLGNTRNTVAGHAEDGSPRGPDYGYARVLLAEHTLGRGQFSARDIRELARILTGWTFESRLLAMGVDHAFHYDYRLHDTGEKVFHHHHLYGVFGDAGVSEGQRALSWLALDPATAQRICTQLAQYFVADTPPPALVEVMVARWADTDGDLREVLQVMFRSPEFRDPARFGAQRKSAYAYVISAVRAAGLHPRQVQPLLDALDALHAAPYTCALPAGCRSPATAAPGDAALERRDAFAEALAQGRLFPGAVDDADAAAAPPSPAALAATLAPGVSDATLTLLAGAPPGERAGLLLRSEDFARR